MYPYFFCSTLLLTGQLCHISKAQTPRLPIRTTISANVITSMEPTESTTETMSIQGSSSTPFDKRNVTESKSDSKALPVTLKSDVILRTTSVTPVTTTLTMTTVKDHSLAVTPPGNTNTANRTSVGSTPTKERTHPQVVTPSHSTRSVLTTAARKSAVVLTSPNGTMGSIPSPAPENSLAMISFGVMTFILVLIVVMVILVTAVNMRGRCHKNKGEGKKICDSLVSEGNVPITGRKESITLVSVKMINTETDIDTPLIPVVQSTSLDSEEQEILKELLNSKESAKALPSEQPYTQAAGSHESGRTVMLSDSHAHARNLTA